MVTKKIFDAVSKMDPIKKGSENPYLGEERKRAKNFTGYRPIGRVGRYKGKTK